MSFHRLSNSNLERVEESVEVPSSVSGCDGYKKVTMSVRSRRYPNTKNIKVKEKLRLWFLTLFYHKSISYEYALDTFIEPLFWFVDHFTHFLGPAFVVVVILLVGSITVIAHILGIPFWYQKSPVLLTSLFIIGYWILMNLVFNFYKVATVSPGLPSDASEIAKCSVTICKKCITPKPPRTHHCSICNKCYLNMDHHCPWVNNCVGHFNRRYFFLTMVYIVMGCCYIMLFGVEMAFRDVFLNENVMPYNCINDTGQLDYQDDNKLSDGSFLGSNSNENGLDDLSDMCDEESVLLFLGIITTRHSFRLILYFAGVLCIGASLALGGLSLWHAKLITMGETSIEYHVNRNDRKKNEKAFINAYDLGKKRNWEVFLGLDQSNINFFRHVLFPSTHLPSGNGYDWSHITSQARRRRQTKL